MADHITRRAFLGATASLALASHVRPADAAPVFSAGERRALSAAVDTILPAGPSMPAASEVGCLAYLENLTEHDAETRRALADVLRRLHADFDRLSMDARVAALRTLEAEHRDAFTALRDLVYEAYYTSPDVSARLGYPVRTGTAPGADLEPFDARLLDRVRQLPRLYRETS